MPDDNCGGRVLALDPGKRRTGIALSDPSGTLASPLETVSLAVSALVEHVAALVRLHGVGSIVIGLPVSSTGEPGEIERLARSLAGRLHDRLGIGVVLWNESLSSWEAERILAERPGRAARGRVGGRAREAREKGEVDRLAAALILQDYLDARAKGEPGQE